MISSLSLLAVLVRTAQAVFHLCCQVVLFMFSFLSADISRSFAAMLLPSQSVPSLCHCKGLFLPQCGTSHFSVPNFTRFFTTFSNVSRSLWRALCPLGYCHLQQVFCCFLQVTDKGSRRGSYSTPLVIGLQLEYVVVEYVIAKSQLD